MSQVYDLHDELTRKVVQLYVQLLFISGLIQLITLVLIER